MIAEAAAIIRSVRCEPFLYVRAGLSGIHSNLSRKLEEYLRNVGVKKYLWLQKLDSDDVKPTKLIYV